MCKTITCYVRIVVIGLEIRNINTVNWLSADLIHAHMTEMSFMNFTYA